MTEPDWVRHAIWWHVYPLGFTGAEHGARPEVVHRLAHLEAWLDYAIRLGASGLALGPIFAAETHGYDTVDHYRIDPRLGDADDFAQLVEAAHGRGLKVLLDGVFNHAGRSFTHPEWFRDTTFEGHAHLPVLDHGSPEVRDYVTDVMCHWLDAGADGWRLDAAYATPRPFWTDVLGRVRRRHPSAYLVGEVIHGDYAATVEETGMHAVTQYELWKAIWSSLGDRNLFELAWALRRHNGYLESFVPLTFVGNHDVTRIASQLPDERLLPHALVVLFTVGGTPAVYYGDEQAFRGVKEERAGGDDAVRPEFPPDPAGLAPWGAATFRLHQDLIGLRRRHPWLHEAHTTARELTNTAAVLDTTDGTRHLLTVLNLAEAPAVLPVPQGEVLLGEVERRGDTVVVPRFGWAVLSSP
jgi:cyclomaltodextrinase